MTDHTDTAKAPAANSHSREASTDKAKEIDGQNGPEPTRYGDWVTESGRCTDF